MLSLVSLVSRRFVAERLFPAHYTVIKGIKRSRVRKNPRGDRRIPFPQSRGNPIQRELIMRWLPAVDNEETSGNYTRRSRSSSRSVFRERYRARPGRQTEFNIYIVFRELSRKFDKPCAPVDSRFQHPAVCLYAHLSIYSSIYMRPPLYVFAPR